MEKKGFKWQMCVGAVFMIIIIISLVFAVNEHFGRKISENGSTDK